MHTGNSLPLVADDGCNDYFADSKPGASLLKGFTVAYLPACTLRKYKEFLDGITPPEWFDAQASKLQRRKDAMMAEWQVRQASKYH
jgi:hypothetical protein